MNMYQKILMGGLVVGMMGVAGISAAAEKAAEKTAHRVMQLSQPTQATSLQVQLVRDAEGSILKNREAHIADYRNIITMVLDKGKFSDDQRAATIKIFNGFVEQNTILIKKSFDQAKAVLLSNPTVTGGKREK